MYALHVAKAIDERATQPRAIAVALPPRVAFLDDTVTDDHVFHAHSIRMCTIVRSTRVPLPLHMQMV